MEHIKINGNMGELTQAINRVSSGVGALKPDKKNTQGNYWYISADKFLDACRKAMAEHGLSITQTITSSNVYVEDKNGKGKPFFCANLWFDMIVADSKGNYMIVPFESAGVDYTVPDKARFKAITSGDKYFKMKLFSVGIGDENNDSEHMVVESKSHEDPVERHAADMVALATKKPAPQKTQAKPKDGMVFVKQLYRDDVAQLYGAMPHMINALRKHNASFQEAEMELTQATGLTIVGDTEITKATARQWFDWLVEYKKEGG